MRKTILIISCMAIGFIVGCGISGKAEPDNEFSVRNITYGMDILKDKVTGVEYIKFCSGNGFVTITPRYNADGTLYTGE
jgi:hypothetical protein